MSPNDSPDFIPLRIFRGPIFHRPVAGQELYFAVTYSKSALAKVYSKSTFILLWRYITLASGDKAHTRNYCPKVKEDKKNRLAIPVILKKTMPQKGPGSPYSIKLGESPARTQVCNICYYFFNFSKLREKNPYLPKDFFRT